VGVIQAVPPHLADGMVAYISATRAFVWLGTAEPPVMNPMIFALRGDRESSVAPDLAVDWIVAMFRGTRPVPGMFYGVPPHLLPAGMDVAFIDASAVVEWGLRDDEPDAAIPIAPNAAMPAPPVPSATTRRNARARAKAKAKAKARATSSSGQRPLMTEQWRAAHPEEWIRISSTYPSECAVCLEEEVTWDGPMDSDIATRCVHLLCVDCWDGVAAADRRCPLCRDDLSEWLAWRARRGFVRRASRVRSCARALALVRSCAHALMRSRSLVRSSCAPRLTTRGSPDEHTDCL
jgi:hypothetical protein